MKAIHFLRVVSAFALLGAVLVGVLTGWVDNPPFDLRVIGATIGAVGAALMEIRGRANRSVS